MNMQDFNRRRITGTIPIRFIALAMSLILIISCQRYENVYELNNQILQSESAGKRKLKTIDQYISILYANLFQKALPASELAEIKRVIESIGDKSLAKEVIISNFMNEADVIVPEDSEMRKDPGQFVVDTYSRFYVRPPTASEKEYFVNLIETRSHLSAEMIYTAFALSDEYQYY